MTTDQNSSGEDAKPHPVSRLVWITRRLGSWTLTSLAITILYWIGINARRLGWNEEGILSNLLNVLSWIYFPVLYLEEMFPIPYQYLRLFYVRGSPESIQFFMVIWFFLRLWLYGILLQIMFGQLDWIKSKSLMRLAQLLFCLIVACVILARIFFRIPLSLNHP
jgi:hypothetical protein